MKKNNKPQDTIIPVFYDKKKIRGKVFASLMLVLMVSIVYVEVITIRSIASYSSPLNNLKAKVMNTVASDDLSIDENSPAVLSLMKSPKKFGFYNIDDENSFSSLVENGDKLDYLIPGFLNLDADGDIVPLNEREEKRIISYVKSKNENLSIIPSITNYDFNSKTFNGAATSAILKNNDKRKKLIEDIHKYVKESALAGITIDFDDIPTADQFFEETFLSELNTALKQDSLLLVQNLPLGDNEIQYARFAKFDDYLILSAYDYNWTTGKSGAIAPHTWVPTSLKALPAAMPREKIIIALGNYGYDWTEKNSVPTELRFDEVLTLAQGKNSKIQIEAANLNPHFTYVDASNLKHDVWYLDAVTFYNQVIEANKYPFGGIALWRMGSEESSVWNIISKVSTPVVALKSLKNINEDDIRSEIGEGVISRIDSYSEPGARNITVDAKTGLINAEEITSYPTLYTIHNYGKADKKIALTFDDGPDPEYTQKILNILKENDVQATFFILGSQANLYPNLVKQAYDNGNEIGNHTYLHPNISEISENQINLELNSTQLLIENITGKQTRLFRPPFGAGQPIDDKENAVLEQASNLDYYWVDMDIDPKDWYAPNSDKIKSSVINKITQGEGNIVLLHDGGGNRGETVKALPEIINDLKSRGYSFVTISSLMGVDKSVIMPDAATQSESQKFVERSGFYLVSYIGSFLRWFLLLGVIIGAVRMVSIISLASINQYRAKGKKYSKEYNPKVSAIVPAWNEEKVICKTVNSLLASRYENLEIIVVDDGSTDQTYQVAYDAFKDNPRVKVFTKPNGGKSSALNYGIEHSKARIIITMDADTIMAPDAIRRMVRHFKDKNVAGVAGNVKVGNRDNLITKFQALEYIISQNLDRKAFHILNSISVVPGSIGAWRRRVIIKSGGLNPDTLAEDTELTLRVLKMGYRIENEPNAIAYTEAPDNFKVYSKQRFRWMFGTLQAVWKIRKSVFNVKKPSLGYIVIPNVLIFQIIFPIISPFIDLFAILSITFTLWQKHSHPEISAEGLNNIILYYLIFTAIDLIVGIFAFTFEKKEDKGLLLYLPAQRLFHKYATYFIASKALITAIRGPQVAWETRSRKATVNDSLIAFVESPKSLPQ